MTPAGERLQPETLRVALVHDWIEQIGGGERVLEALVELFPRAEIFTLFVNRAALEGSSLAAVPLHTSFLQQLPGVRRWYRYALPLLPFAVEQLDVRSFDVVISCSSSVAKGVICTPRQLHLAYVHSPARYVWDLRGHYAKRGLRRLPPIRMFEEVAKHRFRIWDRSVSHSPERLVANSQEVRARIRRTYGREASVVHPPVRVERFSHTCARQDFFLFVGRLVEYKRVDVLIQACNQLGAPLVVVGEGPEMPRLRRMAGPSVRLLGRLQEDEVQGLLATCKAFCYPGIEDFGIAMVEAQAAGAPVIATGAGGALDILTAETGVLVELPRPELFANALRSFEARAFDPKACRENARRFGVERFQEKILGLVERGLRELDAHGSRYWPMRGRIVA